MNKIKALIQQHIKEYRAESNLTLRQFAEELGASHMSVSYWERGDRVPTLDAAIGLANSSKSQHYEFTNKLLHMIAEYEILVIEKKIHWSRESIGEWALDNLISG